MICYLQSNPHFLANMQVISEGDTISTPDSAFVTLSILNDSASLTTTNSSVDEFLSNTDCQKVSSEYIRSMFESRISAMADAFRFLSERADSIISAADLTQDDEFELLDRIFDIPLLREELDTCLPPDFDQAIESTQNEARDWDLDELPKGLFQIASVIERSKRRIYTELSTQFDWKEFTFSEDIDTMFDAEIHDDVPNHTCKAIFRWARTPSTWHVVTSDDCAVLDIIENNSSVSDIFAEEKPSRTNIQIIKADQLRS